MIKSDEIKKSINPKHYLDIIEWLATDRLLHQKEGQKSLVINIVGEFFKVRKDVELTEAQKNAFGYMYHADSFLVKVYVRMILTGCTEQEAFNYVGGTK